MAQKDWDGVMTCVNDNDQCATRSYGEYSSSGSGYWCKPSDTKPKYECYDMPCDGFQNWATTISKSMTPDDMTWRCAEGTCYADCPADKKSVIKIGNKKYDMPWLNCHQTPFFLKVVTPSTGNDYGKVSFHCEDDHSKPPIANGEWHEWGPCGGICGTNKGSQSRHRDCRGTTGNISCNGGPGKTNNREQKMHKQN